MSVVDPNIYQKFVRTGGDVKTFLYVKVLKALYGLFKRALLFYNNLVKYMEFCGIKTNPYDPYVED